MSKKTLLSLVLIFVLAAAFPQAGMAQPLAKDPPPAYLYFVNGISGLDTGQPLMQNPVDISISGLGCVAANVMFRDHAGPFYLQTAGWYAVAVSPANPAAPCSNPAVFWNAWPFQNGQPFVLLTHLTSGGGQTMTLYPYYLGHTTKDNGQARFTIVNGANNASVDMVMRGKKGKASRAVLGLTDGLAKTFQMRSGNYKLQFNPTSVVTPVYGPIEMKTTRFHHYFIALVGSATNGYFTASFSVNTYPFNPIPYNPFPWP